MYGHLFKKTKTTTEIIRLSFSVEYPNKLSNRFIADLQKIHDYIEHFHLSDNFFSKWT